MWESLRQRIEKSKEKKILPKQWFHISSHCYRIHITTKNPLVVQNVHLSMESVISIQNVIYLLMFGYGQLGTQLQVYHISSTVTFKKCCKHLCQVRADDYTFPCIIEKVLFDKKSLHFDTNQMLLKLDVVVIIRSIKKLIY